MCLYLKSSGEVIVCGTGRRCEGAETYSQGYMRMVVWEDLKAENEGQRVGEPWQRSERGLLAPPPPHSSTRGGGSGQSFTHSTHRAFSLSRLHLRVEDGGEGNRQKSLLCTGYISEERDRQFRDKHIYDKSGSGP